MRGIAICGGVAVLVANLLPLLLVQREKTYPGVVGYDTVGAKIKTLDPAKVGDTTSAGIQGNIYEPLYGYHYLKRPVELMPLLAADMPRISEGGLTYTIPIRQGVKYARDPCFGPKGTRQVVAADFVFQLKRVADFHLASPTFAFLQDRVVGLDAWRQKSESTQAGDFSRYKLPVDGLTAVDGHTLRIRLKAPYPQLTMVLAMGCAVPMPREAIEYYLGKDAIENRSPALDLHAVGTGPYRVDAWVRGSKIVLVRNKQYRGDTYPAQGTQKDRLSDLLEDAGKPCPFVDVWRYDIIEEWQPAWLRFLAGQSGTSGVPRDVYASIISPDRELMEGYQRRGIRLIKYTVPVIYWLVINMDDALLGRNRDLRRAMSLAYDVQQEIEIFRNGRGRVAVNIIPDSFKGYEEAGPSPYRRFDLAEARKLLARAGYPAGRGLPAISLDLPGRDRQIVQRGEYFAQQMAQIGIKVEVIPNDWPTLQEKVNKRQCQVYTMGWHADYPDAENFLQLFYSKNASPGPNGANYNNPQYDRLYEQARIMSDSAERTRLYARMARMISEDCPVILTTQPQSWLLIHDWVKNVKPHPIGYGYRKYRRIDVALRRKRGGGR